MSETTNPQLEEPAINFDSDEQDASLEVKPPTKGENIGALFQNPKTRNVIFMSIGVLAVVGVLAFLVVKSGPKAQVEPEPYKGTQAGNAPGDLSKDTFAKESPRYNQLGKRLDDAAASQAEINGTSAQPTTTGAYEMAPNPTQGLTTQNMHQQQQPPTPQQQAYNQAQDQIDRQIAEERRKNAVDTINRNIALWDNIKGARMIQVAAAVAPTPPAVTAAGATPSAVAGAGAQVAANTQTAAKDNKDGVVIITAGTMAPIRFETPINSAEAGYPVVATILSGDFKGSVLSGNFTKNQNDTLKPSFNVLSLNGYGTVTVQAHAFDVEDKMKQGLVTSVERHQIEKYILQPLASAFSAVGTALGRPATTFGTTTGVTATTNPTLTGRDIAGIGLGGAAQQFQKDLGTAPENTVVVQKGTIAGVVFDQDVRYLKAQ